MYPQVSISTLRRYDTRSNLLHLRYENDVDCANMFLILTRIYSTSGSLFSRPPSHPQLIGDEGELMRGFNRKEITMNMSVVYAFDVTNMSAVGAAG